MTKFLEFIDLKKNRLERILASIVFDYLTDRDVCQIGKHLIERKIIKFLSLVEVKDTREVIEKQVRKILRKDEAACLKFLDDYIEERCILKGNRVMKINNEDVEVRIKDEIIYLNGSGEGDRRAIYTYSNDGKFVIEVPSEICISSRYGLDKGGYFEERKRFFVERCKIKNEEGLIEGLAIVSRNREFAIDLRSRNRRNEVDIGDRRASRVRDRFEVFGFVVNDEKKGTRYIPYNKKFRGGYLFFVEITFKHGFLKMVVRN